MDQSDSVFLLLARGVDVGSEERRSMATNKSAASVIVELFGVRLRFVIVRSIMRLLALIDGLVWYDRLRGLHR